MEKGKYIIVKERGHLVPILFHLLISHDTFLNCYHKDNIHSAGFFQIVLFPIHDKHIITVHVFGKSTSLNLKTDDDDAKRIEHLLTTI